MIAICEYGSYEDYGVCFIKIEEKQKKDFECYCLDTQKLNKDDEYSIYLQGYSNLDYESFCNDLDKFNLNLFVKYMTFKEHQERYSF